MSTSVKIRLVLIKDSQVLGGPVICLLHGFYILYADHAREMLLARCTNAGSWRVAARRHRKVLGQRYALPFPYIHLKTFTIARLLTNRHNMPDTSGSCTKLYSPWGSTERCASEVAHGGCTDSSQTDTTCLTPTDTLRGFSSFFQTPF